MYYVVMDVARMDENGLVKVHLSAHAVAGPFETFVDEREARDRIEAEAGKLHGVWFGCLITDEAEGAVPPTIIPVSEALALEKENLEALVGK